MLESNELGVRLGAIKHIKGLEFRGVALARADPADLMNRLAASEALDRCERCIAATRARERPKVTLVA